jgi:hypothetical protein|nr:MAG TPA: hypothetical protein [Caudoviricetes sp.]
MLEKLIKFAVDTIQQIQFDDYDEKEFAIAKVGFLSTRPNSHGLEISEKVLRECASTVLGKWMVAKMNWLGTDATTHEPDEQIMGIFPKEQEIEFVEDDDGYLRAYATAVISKMYAKKYYDMFVDDNERAVSVEMRVETENGDDTNDKVLSLNIVGVTTLGKAVKPSCPESDVTMIRFSQEDADAYFNKMNEHNLTPLKKFAKERIESMAKTYKIDKSKEAMSDKAWGEVDKTAMRDKIMEANNKATLVKAVYMLVEDGWEEAPSEHLKYPVMELKGDTFVYNRDGLTSALGYAKKENETTVVNKIEKIYKKLNLDDNEGGKEEKMAEIEFSAVNIGDLWGRVYAAIREHDAWDYCIQGIYEEDNQKFAILIDRDQKLYRLDFSLTEEGMTASDELAEVKQEFTETDNIKKFAEPENVEQYTKFADPKDEDDEPDDKDDEDGDEPKEESTKMSEDEMMAKIAELEKSVEERDHIIMDKDTELEELRAYKAAVVAKEMACRVDSVMEEVRTYINDEQFAEFKAEGLSCGENDIDAWSNKVKATCFSEVKKTIKKDDKGVFSFAMPKIIKHSDPNSIWEKLESK